MKPLLVANWKMNKTVVDAIEYVQAIGDGLEMLRNIEVVLCPSYVALPVLDGLFKDTRVKLGAQNVSAWKNGAKTGEVSAEMLKPHCQYIIIGHSERRLHCAESLTMVNDKVKRVVQASLTPIICVSNESEIEALMELDDKLADAVVAFEPLEAIGSGQPSDPKTVDAMVKLIKKRLGVSKVLYGGSVDQGNIRTYLKVSDGALIGGASLVAKDFLALCQSVNG